MEKSTDKCNHLKRSVARIQKGTCFVVLLRSHTTSCCDLRLILVALCWVHFYVFAFLWFGGTCAFKLKVTESLWWHLSVLMNRLSQIMMISQKQTWFAADIFHMYKTIKLKSWKEQRFMLACCEASSVFFCEWRLYFETSWTERLRADPLKTLVQKQLPHTSSLLKLMEWLRGYSRFHAPVLEGLSVAFHSPSSLCCCVWKTSQFLYLQAMDFLVGHLNFHSLSNSVEIFRESRCTAQPTSEESFE